MNDLYYPKVLIVNRQSISSNNATGVTMRSIWDGWPKGKLLELCVDETKGNDFIQQVHIEQSFLGKYLGKKRHSKENKDIKNSEVNLTQKRSVKTVIRQVAVGLYGASSLHITHEEYDLLAQFKPDIIYTLGGSVGLEKLAYKISKKLDVPIVLHFMDNWLEHLQWDDNIFLRPYSYSLKYWAKKCLSRSSHSIVISEAMKAAYLHKVYGKIDVLMNSIDTSKYYVGAKESDNGYRLVYAGGLHLNRWKALLDIAKLIHENDYPAVLDIYTSSNVDGYRDYFNQLPVRFHPSVNHESVRSIYKDADILIHVEVDDKQLFGFFKYSISTKIPEYLSTGRPILLYEPREMSLYQYLDNNHAAYLAYDITSLDRALSDAIQQKDKESIVNNALFLAHKNHDICGAKRKLHEIISSAVEEGQ